MVKMAGNVSSLFLNDKFIYKFVVGRHLFNGLNFKFAVGRHFLYETKVQTLQ